MKSRLISITIIIGLFAITACSGGNDDGEDGSVIGLAPEVDDAGGGDSSKTLALGKNFGDAFVEGEVSGSATAIAALSQATFEVTVVDKNNNNALVAISAEEDPSSIVNFTSNCVQSGSATFDPAEVSSTTGSYSSIYTAADGCEGTDTITATFQGSLTATTTLEVAAPVRILAIGTLDDTTFSDGQLVGAIDNLSAGGQTTFTANIVDRAQGDALALFENIVNFTSNCVEEGLATITPSVNTSTGIAVANYTDIACAKVDTVTATLLTDDVDSNPTAITTVQVASSIPGGIQFETIANDTLSLKGFGSSTRPEATQVRFRVVDEKDLPIKGAPVEFKLTNTAGGSALVDSTDANPDISTGESDADGIAIATVIAGRVNTTLAVVAKVTLDGGIELSTISDAISINTGIPDQNSFSLSASELFPHSFDIDGTEVDVIIRAADGYNNPVRDGTRVNFRTEAGAIDPTCETSNGACTVTWRSQNPRPLNTGADAFSVITAYTEGEETISNDINGNGLFDIGEPFEHLPEVFEDINSDGSYSTVIGNNGFDQYVDANENGAYDLANTVYDGLRCTAEAIAAGHCRVLDPTRCPDGASGNNVETCNLIQVRESLNLCITGGEIVFNTVSVSGFTISYTVKDQNGNSLPGGTSITVTAENGDIVGGRTGTVLGGAGGGPNNSCNDGFADTVTGEQEAGATEPLKITITITTPGGATESVLYKF